MASINLDSLSTFWSSIKSYLGSKFSEEVVLWTGSNSSTSGTLSQALNNFPEFRVEYITNDGVSFTKTFMVNGLEMCLPAFHVNQSGTNRAYYKTALFLFSSTYTTFSFGYSHQTNLNNGSVTTNKYTTASSSVIFPLRIIGIKR